ncbi:MAG: hypothetical protein FJY07_09650 [Bacteroidetes bacterium]|nr:hypothetical protein [Bacteroidota bacterium]
MELQKDFDKLADAETFLSQFAGSTIIIDEVQRNKKLFPVLRALIDRNNVPGRFLLLGSAGPDLIRHSSESLAGRIAYIELTPFLVPEIIHQFSIEELWVKGGFPVAPCRCWAFLPTGSLQADCGAWRRISMATWSIIPRSVKALK